MFDAWLISYMDLFFWVSFLMVFCFLGNLRSTRTTWSGRSWRCQGEIFLWNNPSLFFFLYTAACSFSYNHRVYVCWLNGVFHQCFFAVFKLILFFYSLFCCPTIGFSDLGFLSLSTGRAWIARWRWCQWSTWRAGEAKCSVFLSLHCWNGSKHREFCWMLCGVDVRKIKNTVNYYCIVKCTPSLIKAGVSR